MRLRPRLVVRYTKRRGGILSSTSNLGYGFYGLIGLVLSVGLIAAALSGSPAMLLGLIVTGFPLRDALAWFLATPEEREEFRAKIAELRATGKRPPADQAIIIPSNWSGIAILGSALWLAASVLVFIIHERRPEAVVSGMFALSFLVTGLIDAARRRVKASR
jgi:hypothetical protein